MTLLRRLPWTPPNHSESVSLPRPEAVLRVRLGDPLGQLVAIAHHRCDAERRPRLEILPEDVIADELTPALVDTASNKTLCDDPITLAASLSATSDVLDETTRVDIEHMLEHLFSATYRLGQQADQATYENDHGELSNVLRALNNRLEKQRFLGGASPSLADDLLVTYCLRLDPVYYELFKASVGLLADFPALDAFTRDRFEDSAVYETTDFDAIKRHHYLHEPVLNPHQIIPAGGIPNLHAPHFRIERFAQLKDAGTEESTSAPRVQGEWVRPQSKERHWITSDPDARFPAEADRYHIYAPFNCPWSHRALLVRSVKGLDDVIGASVVYFRRDGERGWQFNPAIPGCTADLAEGKSYVRELYESVGSSEKSVPVLWDTKTKQIVSNESAEIVRMLNNAFGDLATNAIDLYPDGHRASIDRINELVYHRINNGAYKAGFTSSQVAYQRAFDRYFAALDWLEARLSQSETPWLAGTPDMSEADLRLFPTLFRHDAVYYARFRLNRRRIRDYPVLSRWLGRMLDYAAIARASNLDHARNGYFGRSGNQIVPAGPVPLGLSPKDFDATTWRKSRPSPAQ